MFLKAVDPQVLETPLEWQECDLFPGLSLVNGEAVQPYMDYRPASVNPGDLVISDAAQLFPLVSHFKGVSQSAPQIPSNDSVVERTLEQRVFEDVMARCRKGDVATAGIAVSVLASQLGNIVSGLFSGKKMESHHSGLTPLVLEATEALYESLNPWQKRVAARTLGEALRTTWWERYHSVSECLMKSVTSIPLKDLSHSDCQRLVVHIASAERAAWARRGGRGDSQAFFATLVGAPGVVLMAHGNFVGYVVSELVGGVSVEIVAAWVHPGFRGLGLASKMYMIVFKQLKGMSTVVIDILEDRVEKIIAGHPLLFAVDWVDRFLLRARLRRAVFLERRQGYTEGTECFERLVLRVSVLSQLAQVYDCLPQILVGVIVCVIACILMRLI